MRTPPQASPGRTRNPRGQGERLRHTLIDSAIELLADLPDVQALSVRAVTAHAGVTPTALYLHFADKEDLLAAVKERCFGELRQYVLAGEQSAPDEPRAQAAAMCRAYLRFAAERPGYYRVLFHTPRGDPGDGGTGEPERTWPARASQAHADLINGIARCLPPGVAAEPVATMIWAGLHGYVGLSRSMRHYPFPGWDEYVERLLDAHLGVVV
jgi:AcrR family transcriptional regulator